MTTITVGVAEAHDRLSELIDQALAGTEVVIAKRSTPAVRLTPVMDSTEQPNGAKIVAIAEAYLAQYGGRTTEEIDAYLKEERDSWRRPWDPDDEWDY